MSAIIKYTQYYVSNSGTEDDPEENDYKIVVSKIDDIDYSINILVYKDKWECSSSWILDEDDLKNFLRGMNGYFARR